MKKYLEYQDEKSYKFWQVEVNGNSHTVKYGKIGTDGQTKVKEFDSPEAALKDAEKQALSKMKKGYEEKSSQSEKRVSKRFHIHGYEGEDGKKLMDQIRPYFEKGQGGDVTHLIIGCWEYIYENSPQEIVDYIIEKREQLPNVTSIHMADIENYDSEISWITLCDLGPLLMAFPKLTEFKIQGSQQLRLTGIKHDNLKKLTIECGGLGSDALADIAAADLPALEKLELYLGVEDYGFDGSVEDVKPFMEKGRFPKLTYLGLMNSGITDEIAIEVANASILDQVEILDLSMGTISDKGAEALLASEKIKKLNFLNLRHHYMSDEMMKKIKKIGIPIDISDAEGDDFMDEDDDWDDRYPEITE